MRAFRPARLLVAALLLLPLLGSAAGATEATTTRSGLYGLVERGPIMPVCLEGAPCDEPAAGVTLSFVRSRLVVARARTTEQGRYRIRLRPGAYSVRTSQRPLGTVPSPPRVWVPRGRFARVDFHIDTGIR